MKSRLLVGNRWSQFDPDPEAVAWRKANKKRMRPYVCKLPGPLAWMRPVGLVLALGVMVALAL